MIGGDSLGDDLAAAMTAMLRWAEIKSGSWA